MVPGDRTDKKKSVSENKSKKRELSSSTYKNLLVMKPVRLSQWRYKDDDKTIAVIIFPRFGSKLGKKLGKIYDMKDERRLHLDEYGTAVWKLCTGNINVKDIGEVLLEQFGTKIEPLYDRLGEFLRIMEKHKCIKFKPMKKVSK